MVECEPKFWSLRWLEVWKRTGNRQRTDSLYKYLNSDKRRGPIQFRKTAGSNTSYTTPPLYFPKGHSTLRCSSVHKKCDIKGRLHLLDPLFKNISGISSTMNTRSIWRIPHRIRRQSVLVFYIDDGLYFEADDLKDTFVRHCVISTTARLFFFWPRVLF